ncbi:hypothetical protein ACFQU2_03705 [Siccirubricoccus deserti]
MRTANFLDTIGVNTHINWQDSGSAYANQETIKEAIEYLGVGYVRDGVPYEGWTLPFYQELANAGVKFNLLTMATAFNETGSFETDLDRISALAEISPGSVASIEGLNEINTWTVDYKGQNTGSNLALGREVQALLYSQVQADAALASIPVLNLTVGGLTAQQASVMGDMSELADYGTWHTYFGNGDQPWPTSPPASPRPGCSTPRMRCRSPKPILHRGRFDGVGRRRRHRGGAGEVRP